MRVIFLRYFPSATASDNRNTQSQCLFRSTDFFKLRIGNHS